MAENRDLASSSCSDGDDHICVWDVWSDTLWFCTLCGGFEERRTSNAQKASDE